MVSREGEAMTSSVLVRNEVEPAWLDERGASAEEAQAERQGAEHLVLSAAAHQVLTEQIHSGNGDVRIEHLAMAGKVMLHPGEDPGSVRVTVELRDTAAGGQHGGLGFEANVRRAWLRSVCADSLESPDGVARIVRALAEIAALPNQTTVRVVHGDR